MIAWFKMFTGSTVNPETLHGAEFKFWTWKHSLYVKQIGPNVNEKRRLTFNRPQAKGRNYDGKRMTTCCVVEMDSHPCSITSVT